MPSKKSYQSSVPAGEIKPREPKPRNPFSQGPNPAALLQMLNLQSGQITRGAILIHSKTASIARSLGTRMSNRMMA